MAIAIAWAWFASGVRTFTRPAEVLTFVPGMLVLIVVLLPVFRVPRPAPKPRYRLGSVLPWLVLLTATVSWELTQLFSAPRSNHPTLSSMTNTVLSTHPTRFLGYLGWLALGWLLIRDVRTRRSSP